MNFDFVNNIFQSYLCSGREREREIEIGIDREWGKKSLHEVFFIKSRAFPIIVNNTNPFRTDGRNEILKSKNI